MFAQATTAKYLTALTAAQTADARIAGATTPAMELDLDGAMVFLSADENTGYAVKASGELVGVFSTIKGRGDAIVADAIVNGANALDCFDGYLPSFYARHGFVETARAANWTAGAPDVVFMALAR
jgi:hypothetical protein